MHVVKRSRISSASVKRFTGSADMIHDYFD